uniref:Uncharacterized protein n=1 Tax=Rhipicephalus zambeziensis TaxID=60191 RepID=A0A224YLE1_9ACAR
MGLVRWRAKGISYEWPAWSFEDPPSASPTDEKAATVHAVFSRVGVIFTGLENAAAAEAARARQAHQSRYFRSKKGDSQRNVVWGPTL